VKQPAPDLIVAGKYCLDRQLASGGMGSVWVARHLDLDLDVAIKFMDPDCASDEGRIRFELEAKAAAHLQSPYVVNVLDYGVDDDLPYIVMELLNGEDLEDRLQREGRISLEDAQKILTQASKALRRAQEIGVVHRDIKPHNLFLAKGDDNEETLKILDFGIAKETGPALVGEGTNTGHIVGSPNYMSPEHVRGARDIDSRSDLWSLGVVLFQAVTGRLPFPGDVVGDVIGMILADPIPRATEIAPDLPPAVDDFFFKALARDRSLRFQSAREMADAFNEIVRTSIPPGMRESLPGSMPAPPTHRKDVPTIDIGDAAAKGSVAAATTAAAARTGAAMSGEDTVAKTAVVDTSKAPRRPAPRIGAFAAASALVVAGILLVIFRVTAPSEAEVPGVEPPAGAQAGAPVEKPQEQPKAGDPAQTQAPSAGQGAPQTQAPSGQQAGGARATTSPQDRTSGGAVAAPGASGAPGDTSATDNPTTSGAAPHVGDKPFFDVDTKPGDAATKPTGKVPTSTTKPGDKPKTPAGSSTSKPNWGF
jgi:hypothetical protein